MIIRDYAGEIPGIMKVLTAFLLFVVATTAEDFCYQDTLKACNPTAKNFVSEIPNCHAKYGAIETLQGSLQHYANNFIHRSFNFLLMSTHFGNYINNRPGFEKLYRSLSDSLWDDGIELIKYIDSRGGKMEFSNISQQQKLNSIWEVNEVQSLATALDLEKSLMDEAFRIHLTAEEKGKNYDPEIAHHIEEEFLTKERDVIRRLAGYTHDLSQLLNTTDASLAVYLFDGILHDQKY